MQLVNTLHGVIQAQIREGALCGLGEYALDPHYQSFAVSRDVWFAHSQKKQNRIFHKFMQTRKKGVSEVPCRTIFREVQTSLKSSPHVFDVNRRVVINAHFKKLELDICSLNICSRKKSAMAAIVWKM